MSEPLPTMVGGAVSEDGLTLDNLHSMGFIHFISHKVNAFLWRSRLAAIPSPDGSLPDLAAQLTLEVLQESH